MKLKLSLRPISVTPSRCCEWKNWARVEKCTIAFTGLSQTEPKYSTKWSRSAKMTKPMQGIITAAVSDYDWYLGLTESDRFQIDNHNNIRQSWENHYWTILDIFWALLSECLRHVWSVCMAKLVNLVSSFSVQFLQLKDVLALVEVSYYW